MCPRKSRTEKLEFERDCVESELRLTVELDLPVLLGLSVPW